MPYYDLNVPWAPNEASLQPTIALLNELGYNTVALSHTLSGKLPADLSCPIPAVLPFPLPENTHVLRRCTLILSDPSQNHRLSSLSTSYDILALRPTSEKTLQQACSSLECDIISIDLTQRLDYHFKMKTLAQAVERGIKLEICYAPGLLSSDNTARRNLISNATQLIRAARGRGIIISSEARKAAACRGPEDVINLAAVWGLGQERGKEAVMKLARSVVVSAQLKRTSFRGAIDVIYAGEKPQSPAMDNRIAIKKRKADAMEGPKQKGIIAPKAPSNREKKRREKAAQLEAANQEKTKGPGAG